MVVAAFGREHSGSALLGADGLGVRWGALTVAMIPRRVAPRTNRGHFLPTSS